MRIYSRLAGSFLIAFGLTGAAYAFDAPTAPSASDGDAADGAPAPASHISSASLPGAAAASASSARNPIEAFEKARSAYRSGDKTAAVLSLQYAAGRGHAGAQWMLGRMYAEGDGVAHDDEKAFYYFREVVREASASNFLDSYDQQTDGPYVSSALVWLGSYYLEGIPGTPVKPDPKIALRLFTDAAYNFGDPNAQYNLARMYLDGNGVKRDPERAVRWLNLAAQKNHAPSRALLGHMMFKGEFVHKAPAKGLMLMALARATALESNDPSQQWMIDLYDKAVAGASDEERKQAAMLFDAWTRRHQQRSAGNN